MKVLILLISTIFIGCTAAQYWKGYNMRTMIRETKKRYYEPVGSKTYGFENKQIKITYIPDVIDGGNEFVFVNKSKKVIKLIWDEIAYLDPAGSSSGVFHVGVRLVDRATSKPPTILIPNGTHKDHITPVDKVEFDRNEWLYQPLCGEKSIVMHDLDDTSCIGKVFGYYITYEIEGKKKSATVRFKYIKSVDLPNKKRKKKKRVF